MAKLNWENRNKQNLIHKKGYGDIYDKISPYKQCAVKQYKLIEKLMQESQVNKKLVKQFLFCDLKTNKLLKREKLTKRLSIVLIYNILNKKLKNTSLLSQKFR